MALAEEPEEGAIETSRFEKNFGSIVIAHNDTDTRGVVVGLDETLIHTFSTFPALMQEVQTLARRELVPCFTRIFWMLGLQVFEDRLWENETCLPVHGFLPQTSHLYAMRGKTS